MKYQTNKFIKNLLLIIGLSLTVISCYALTNNNTVNEILFIDSAVDDYETLLKGADHNKITNGKLQIKILDSKTSGIKQISDYLKSFNQQLEAVHIVSHGNIAELKLGSDTLNNHSLNKFKNNLTSWKQSFTPQAEILIYGCNVAQGLTGRKFIQDLNKIIGASIAASSNPTGSSKLGGDWELEITSGDIKSQLAFNKQAQTNFTNTLAVYTVTSSANAGSGTLREAIDLSNSNPGHDYIYFKETLNGQTIIIHNITDYTKSELSITDHLTIDATTLSGFVWDDPNPGPYEAKEITGSNLKTGITIQTHEDSTWVKRLFIVNDVSNANGIDVTIKGLTIILERDSSKPPAIFLARVRNVTIEKNIFHIVKNGLRAINMYIGSNTETKFITIKNNIIQGKDPYPYAGDTNAINIVSSLIRDADRIYIKNNTINDMTSRAIFVQAGMAVNIENITISNNYINRIHGYVNVSDGIVLGTTSGTNYVNHIVTYNTIIDYINGGITLGDTQESLQAEIYGNIVHTNKTLSGRNPMPQVDITRYHSNRPSAEQPYQYNLNDGDNNFTEPYIYQNYPYITGVTFSNGKYIISGILDAEYTGTSRYRLDFYAGKNSYNHNQEANMYLGSSENNSSQYNAWASGGDIHFTYEYSGSIDSDYLITAQAYDKILRRSSEMFDINKSGTVSGVTMNATVPSVVQCGAGYYTLDGTNCIAIAVCGNDIVEAGENCEKYIYPDSKLHGWVCASDCSWDICWDSTHCSGVSDYCVDNDSDPDTINYCKHGSCGDKVNGRGEECDIGNYPENDGVYVCDSCKWDRCDGDTKINSSECDANDYCVLSVSYFCKHGSCGDGIIGSSEKCDDADPIRNGPDQFICKNCDWDLCATANDCESTNSYCDGTYCLGGTCGDGKIGKSEDCEPGVAPSGPNNWVCKNSCSWDYCNPEQCTSGTGAYCANDGSTDICKHGGIGDGVIGYNEVCDDGNKISLDGCSSTGQIESGYVCSIPGVLCTDINECATDNGGCGFTELCTNTKGGSSCGCGEGLEKTDGKTFINISGITDGAFNVAKDSGGIFRLYAGTNVPTVSGSTIKCMLSTQDFQPGSYNYYTNKVICFGSNDPTNVSVPCTWSLYYTDGRRAFQYAAPYSTSYTPSNCFDNLNTNATLLFEHLPASTTDKVCLAIIGDGKIAGYEKCDDGNEKSGDGCSYLGDIEPGYECPILGSSCKDIDECTTNTHNCYYNESCNNTPGSFTCSCKTNFKEYDGKVITDAGKVGTNSDVQVKSGVFSIIKSADNNLMLLKEGKAAFINSGNGAVAKYPYGNEKIICINTKTFTPGGSTTYTSGLVGCFGFSTNSNDCIWSIFGADGGDKYPYVNPFSISFPNENCRTLINDRVTAGDLLFELSIASSFSKVCSANIGDSVIAGGDFKAGYEQCDDSNTESSDGCSSFGFIENGYSCPDAGQKCVSLCGNNIVDSGEDCEKNTYPDSNLHGWVCYNCKWDSCPSESSSECVATGDYCADDGNSFECKHGTCGDNKIGKSEDCEPGVASSGPDNWVCKNSCSWDYCNPEQCTSGTGAYCANDGSTDLCKHGGIGDGVIGYNEVCDDGNKISLDGCSSTGQIESGYICSIPNQPCVLLCGNNIVDSGEDCEKGGYPDSNLNGWVCYNCKWDSCPSESSSECVATGDYCEDDGNSFECKHGTCGDDKIGKNEDCEPGVAPSGPNNWVCKSSCTWDYCIPEQCTSGTGAYCANDGNTDICRHGGIGDGKIGYNEVCDDGNKSSLDGCSSTGEIESGYSCPTAGQACVDINECDKNTDDCHANANCTNNPGSFTCTCKPGYTGDGKTCDMIPGQTYTVDKFDTDDDDNNYDPGELTLREAIILSNVTTDKDVIKFASAGTIYVKTSLPSITNDLVIDGSIDTTFFSTPPGGGCVLDEKSTNPTFDTSKMVTISQGADDLNVIEIAGGSDVTIKSIHFYSDGINWIENIEVGGAFNGKLTIQQNIFEAKNVTIGSFAPLWIAPTFAAGDDIITIKNNLVIGHDSNASNLRMLIIPNTGVVSEANDRVIVSNNNIQSFDSAGISIILNTDGSVSNKSDFNIQVTNNCIDNISASGDWGFGIQIRSRQGAYLANNKITNTDKNSIYFSDSQNKQNIYLESNILFNDSSTDQVPIMITNVGEGTSIYNNYYPNDNDDVDNLQNHPIITSVVKDATTNKYTILGRLDSNDDTTTNRYQIDFFAGKKDTVQNAMFYLGAGKDNPSGYSAITTDVNQIGLKKDIEFTYIYTGDLSTYTHITAVATDTTNMASSQLFDMSLVTPPAGIIPNSTIRTLKLVGESCANISTNEICDNGLICDDMATTGNVNDDLCKYSIGTQNPNCTIPSNCVTGSKCDPTDNNICKTILSVGGVCSVANTICDSGLSCDGGICKYQLGETNQNCPVATLCITGSKCDADTKCKTELAVTQDCTDKNKTFCASGLTCDTDNKCKYSLGTTNSACPDASNCVSTTVCSPDGKCSIGLDINGDCSVADTFCNAGLVCDNMGTTAVTSDDRCKYDFGTQNPSCTTASDCVTGSECDSADNNICKTKLSAGGNCSVANTYCDTGLSCDSGTCKYQLGETNSNCPDASLCITGSKCDADTKCKTELAVTQDCTDINTTFCSTDLTCDTDNKCKHSLGTTNSACPDASNCVSTTVCSPDGKCSIGLDINGDCSVADTFCNAGLVCDNMGTTAVTSDDRCKYDFGTQNPSCTTASDCVTGSECDSADNNICKTKLSAGGNCSVANTYCDTGLSCDSGTCKYQLGETNSNCPDASLCISGSKCDADTKCKTELAVTQDCTDKNKTFCASGLTCDTDNKCKYSLGTTNSACPDASNCVSTTGCSPDGKCLIGLDINGDCSVANTFCNAGLVCDNMGTTADPSDDRCKYDFGTQNPSCTTASNCVTSSECDSADNNICKTKLSVGGDCNVANTFCDTGLSCDSGICKYQLGQINPNCTSPSPDDSLCISGASCDTTDKKCKTKLAVTNDCTDTNTTFCAADLTCDTDNKCKHSLGTTNPSCPDASNCVSTTGCSPDGKCLIGLDINGDCSMANTFCNSGLVCDDMGTTTITSDDRCKYYWGTPNPGCTTPSDCFTSTECDPNDNNICKSKLDLNGDCTLTNVFCDIGLACDSNDKCKYTANQTNPGCPDATDCIDNLVCYGGKCVVEFCGDSIKTINETCDDGNSASNDGCSSTCQVEGDYECRTVGSLCLAPNTKSCAVNSCIPGLECKSNICVVKPGANCATEPKSCPSPHVCDSSTNTCKVQPSVSCSADPNICPISTSCRCPHDLYSCNSSDKVCTIESGLACTDSTNHSDCPAMTECIDDLTTNNSPTGNYYCKVDQGFLCNNSDAFCPYGTVCVCPNKDNTNSCSASAMVCKVRSGSECPASNDYQCPVTTDCISNYCRVE